MSSVWFVLSGGHLIVMMRRQRRLLDFLKDMDGSGLEDLLGVVTLYLCLAGEIAFLRIFVLL